MTRPDPVFTTTIGITAPSAKVWEVVRDVERWREWTPTVKGIIRLGREPLGAGSRLLIRQPKLPPALWRVTGLEEGRGFTSVTGTPLVRVTARHYLTPEGERTNVTLSIEFSGLFGAWAARKTRALNERYLALEAEGLKNRCEGLH